MDTSTLGFKIIATKAFGLFGLLGFHSVWSLGFGWYGISVVALIIGAFLYELWFIGRRDEQYKIGVLKTIEGFRGENVKLPQNLMDAKDLVTMLREDREILADAYVALYQENKLLESTKPDTDDFMAGIE